MSNLTKQRLAIACNAYIAVSVTYGIIRRMPELGWGTFVYYTQDSNIFAAVVGALFVVQALKAGAWNKPVSEFGGSLRLLRFLATCCLTITFCVSLFVLSPYPESGGIFGMFFTPVRFTMHLTSPLLSLISFVLLESNENTPRLNGRHVVLSLIPSLLYASVLYPLNAFQIVRGPYPFFLVCEMPVWQSILWFAGLVVAFLLIGQLIKAIANRV